MTEPTISELQAQIAIYDEKFRASEAHVLSLMKELRSEQGGWPAARALEREIADRSKFYDADAAILLGIIEMQEPAWVLGFSDPIPNDPIRNLRLS